MKALGAARLARLGLVGGGISASSTVLCRPDCTGALSRPLLTHIHSEARPSIRRCQTNVKRLHSIMLVSNKEVLVGQRRRRCVLYSVQNLNSRVDISLFLWLSSSPAPSLLIFPPFLLLPPLVQAIPPSPPLCKTKASSLAKPLSSGILARALDYYSSMDFGRFSLYPLFPTPRGLSKYSLRKILSPYFGISNKEVQGPR